jgi:hypothetical protein
VLEVWLFGFGHEHGPVPRIVAVVELALSWLLETNVVGLFV